MPDPSANNRMQFGGVSLRVLPGDYVVVHLPAETDMIPGEWFRPATTQFGVLIRDPKAVTLVVARRKWLGMQNLFNNSRVSAILRIVTLDVGRQKHAERSLAAVGQILTKAGIAAAPLSSFHSDHILVSRQDLPRAIRMLRQHLVGVSDVPARRKPKPGFRGLTS